MRSVRDRSDPHSQLVILGAGASYGARSGQEAPPLGGQLASYLARWIEDNRGFATTYQWDTPSLDLLDDTSWLRHTLAFLKRAEELGNFELAIREVFQDYDAKGDWYDVTPLHRLIAQAMLVGRGCRFLPKMDGYDELLAKFGWPGQDLVAITLNYDILLEEAAARRLGSVDHPGRAVHYPGVRGQDHDWAAGPQRLTVYKPHGSINWLGTNNHVAIGPDPSDLHPRPGEPSRHGILGLDTGDEYVPPEREALMMELREGLARPILGVYGHGKPAQENSSALDAVCRRCLSEVVRDSSVQITMVGVHIPEEQGDDPFLDDLVKLLRDTAIPTTYVSPSRRDCERARAQGFTTVCADLAKFIAA